MPVDTENLAGVLTGVRGARGLPNEYYVDAEAFEIERRKVFQENWAGIGFAKDVSQPGDALPISFLGMPLLLVRDRDGAVRVFQNTCRHRGMILVEEKTRLRGIIRCPYHSWCYGLDGSLLTTPHVGGPGQNVHPDIDRATLGLIEIRSHVWLDVVYVNISGTAAPFEEVHADLLQRWKEFDRPIYHGGPESSFKLDVKTNWKLAVENYCESYHLPWVHPGLNSYSRLEDHYNIVEYGRFSGQGTMVYRPTLDAEGRKFVDFPDLSSKWDTAAEYITVFPNVMLGVHRDHTFAILLEPQGLEQTVEHIEIYYTSPEMLGDAFEPLRNANSTLWKSVFVEDVFVVEGMQRGRHGVKFDGGVFSPVMDEPTHVFHHWVAGKLAA